MTEAIHPQAALQDGSAVPEKVLMSGIELTYSGKQIVIFLKMVADEMRLRVLLTLLDEGEINVGTLCRKIDSSQPAVSHHLALIKLAGMATSERRGQENFWQLTEKTKKFLKEIQSAWAQI